MQVGGKWGPGIDLVRVIGSEKYSTLLDISVVIYSIPLCTPVFTYLCTGREVFESELLLHVLVFLEANATNWEITWSIYCWYGSIWDQAITQVGLIMMWLY